MERFIARRLFIICLGEQYVQAGSPAGFFAAFFPGKKARILPTQFLFVRCAKPPAINRRGLCLPFDQAAGSATTRRVTSTST